MPKIHKVEYGKYKDKTFTWLVAEDYDYFKKVKGLFYKYYDLETRRAYRHALKKYEGKNIKGDARKYTPQVVSWIRDQKPKEKIKSQLLAEGLEDKDCQDLISAANKVIQRSYEEEKDLLIDLHILRYEEIFFNNIEPDLSHLPPRMREDVMAEHKLTALETLHSKEKVLGMHTRVFKVKLNTFYQKQKEKEKPDIDPSLLSTKNLNLILELINKTKNKDDSNKVLIHRGDYKEEQVIEYTSFEEVIESPMRASIQTDVMLTEKNKDQGNGSKTLLEVQQTIEKSLAEKIKEMYNISNTK